MKTKKLIIATALAGALVTSSAFAQSVFQGFYGQIGIGYESSAPSFSGGNVTGTPYNYSISSSNLNYFTGTVAAGYYFPITNAFLLALALNIRQLRAPQLITLLTFLAPNLASHKG